MPLAYLRHLTSPERTDRANRHLARILAGVAGAINAGGFLAVGQYTSHMSGIVASMADNAVLGGFALVWRAAGGVGAFLLGAFVTTLMIRFSRARGLASMYSAPLVVEAVLLVVFGVTGRRYSEERSLFPTVMLLCFTMGLQNAMVTKISGAVIRTTHMTGMITDMGIALGRLVYREAGGEPVVVGVEQRQLRLHGSLVLLFLGGGVVGALGFRQLGFLFTLPFAAVLAGLGVLPLWDDLLGYRDREVAGK